MGTSGTFEIVRTPASYIISRSGHGKLEKTGSFRILANCSNAKIFKRYPGYAIGKLTSSVHDSFGGNNWNVDVIFIHKTKHINVCQFWLWVKKRICHLSTSGFYHHRFVSKPQSDTYDRYVTVGNFANLWHLENDWNQFPKTTKMQRGPRLYRYRYRRKTSFRAKSSELFCKTVQRKGCGSDSIKVQANYPRLNTL